MQKEKIDIYKEKQDIYSSIEYSTYMNMLEESKYAT